jgi:ribosomal-protein-alanine N-acetyltransferase
MAAVPRTLTTERLLLRPLTLDDAPFVLELVTEPDWIRFIGDKNVRTLDDARRYLIEGPLRMYAEYGVGSLCVTLKDTGEPVGICGLIKRPGLDDVDIGFAFLERHRGKGYGAESSLAILEHARRELQLARVVAITTPDNAASMKLLEKIGLRYERDVALPSRSDPSRLFGIDLRENGKRK